MAHNRNVVLLITSTLVASWMGMQAVHELGHCLGAWATGGSIARVILKPWTISQTILAENPKPLAVVWAGPTIGVTVPLLIWAFAKWRMLSISFALRFFAGFCLVANGLYIGIGSFFGIGDCGEMLRHGSELWQLWSFGLLTIPFGFWLWNGEGKHFGLGQNAKPISKLVAAGSLLSALVLFALGLWL